jgi:D-aspartate ligase
VSRRGDAYPPAVVLGGYANAVSVTRSLARLGVHVYALGDSTSEVRHSRLCGTFVDLGVDEGVQSRWLDWLSTGPRRGALLPCSDDGLELIARNRTILLEHGYVPFEADDEVALAMLDKYETYERARQLGIATPATFKPESRDALEQMMPAVDFPCALKPVHAHVFHRRARVPEKLIVVQDADQLRAAFDSFTRLGLDLLVSEIVPGGDDQLPSYYTFLDEQGEPLLHFGTRKLRQFPPQFGHGCYRLSEWDDDVAELGLRFLQGVGVRGLAMVEFKRDARDGNLKLIECNHRFTSATELVRKAGIDLASFTYLRLVGRPLPRHVGFRQHVYLWCPADDLRTFLAYRKTGTLSLAGWLQSLLRRQHFPIFDPRDPKPTLAYHWSLFRRMLQVIWTGRRSSVARR